MKKLERRVQENPFVNITFKTLVAYTAMAAVSTSIVLAYKGINYLNEIGFFEYLPKTFPSFQ